MKTKAIAVVLLFCTLPIATRSETVEEIVARVYAARGGLTRIRAVRSERITGIISFGSDASGPFFVELKRPQKMHMQLTVQNQTMVRVFDGKNGWANNPFAGKITPDTMSDEDLRSISEEADFDGPLVDYRKKGNQVELVSKDKVEDRDVWKLKLTTKTGDVRFYSVDAKTFLVLKWEGKRQAEGKEFPVEAYFRDYREVEGLKFAFEINSGSSATDLTQKIEIDKIEINPQIADTEFDKPGAPAPADGSAPAAPPANPQR